jgi:hypothetical protein
MILQPQVSHRLGYDHMDQLVCTKRSNQVDEVRPRKDKRGVDLISDVLPFGRLWYDTPDNAIGYAKHRSRSRRF